jgi:hypothetical protein
VPRFVAAWVKERVAICRPVSNQESSMGFLFKWIFRGLLIWITVVVAQSCGNTQVYSDDVPVTPLPATVPGSRGGS